MVEPVGNPTDSWEDPEQNAPDKADETLENTSGIETASQTADVENGRIDRYKTTVHVSLELQNR